MTAKPAATRTLSDLRPNATIRCLYCDQPKPQAGSQKFHKRDVCSDCVTKLQRLQEKPK